MKTKKTEYNKGRHDELQKVVSMIQHYIRSDSKATLERAYDQLKDRLLCMEAERIEEMSE